MTYEYRCNRCGHVQEKLMVPLDRRDDLVECEECGGLCDRLISPVSYHFKYYKRLYGKRVDEGRPGFGSK